MFFLAYKDAGRIRWLLESTSKWSNKCLLPKWIPSVRISWWFSVNFTH